MKLLSTVTWLSPLLFREKATPNYSLNEHALDHTERRPQLVHCVVGLAAARRSHSAALAIFFMEFRGP